MWNPVKISLENLFSHIETEYEFKNNVCTLIMGKNKTDIGQENNGSGKSTIFEAIYMSLTGKSLRNLNKESFINRNTNYCIVDISLTNEYLKKQLRVRRKISRGKKAELIEIYVNNDLITDFSSVGEANQFILDELGLLKDDLQRYFLISQDNKFNFFTAGDAEQKEIINRITSADIISPVLNKLKDDNSRFSALVSNLNREIERIEAKMEIIDEQIAKQQERSESQASNVAELKKEIKELKMSVSINNKRKAEINLTINSFKKNLEILNKTKHDVSLKKQERRKLSKKIDEAKDLLSNIKRKLNNVATCPDCGSEFMLEDHPMSLSVLRGSKKLTEELIDELTKEKRIIDKEINETEELIDKIVDVEDKIEALKHDCKKLERANDINQQSITAYGEQIQKISEDKDDITASLMSQREEMQSIIIKRTEELEEQKANLDMVKFWEFNMGKQGFSTFLANKSVKLIEGVTNGYLKKFGTDLSVVVNGFKILKTGEVREKIEIFAQTDGLDDQVFLAKSGGERGRLQLAGVLGMWKLINDSTNGRGLNLLLLDEVFPGMDAKGQENVIKILEKMGITILMITQRITEDFGNQHRLYIIKEQGISKITDEEGTKAND